MQSLPLLAAINYHQNAQTTQIYDLWRRHPAAVICG
jgi:hypothetical protein